MQNKVTSCYYEYKVGGNMKVNMFKKKKLYVTFFKKDKLFVGKLFF